MDWRGRTREREIKLQLLYVPCNPSHGLAWSKREREVKLHLFSNFATARATLTMGWRGRAREREVKLQARLASLMNLSTLQALKPMLYTFTPISKAGRPEHQAPPLTLRSPNGSEFHVQGLGFQVQALGLVPSEPPVCSSAGTSSGFCCRTWLVETSLKT